jgi:hypothetical protein
VASCADPKPTGPQPQSVIPDTGTQSRETSIQIIGSNFRPLIHANYDDVSSSNICTTFVARLGDHPLNDVRYVGTTELTATVPAGLEPGTYDLIVIDPAGRQGLLENAFSVPGDEQDAGPLDGLPVDGLPADGLPDEGQPTDVVAIDVVATDVVATDIVTTDMVITDAGVPDVAVPDVALPDVAVPDVAVPDVAVPDVVMPPDVGVYHPLSPTALANAWQDETVPCIDRDGNQQGNDIPIIDTANPTYFDGAVTLQNAPADTIAWVGNESTVTVRWDPNACDLEDPWVDDGDWESACLLIRGATLDGNGNLVLQPWVTETDINLVNCQSDGTFQDSYDFILPDDSELSLHPQLVNPVNAAKTALIQAASN